MKKLFITFILSTSLTMSFIGCSSSTTDTSTNTESTEKVDVPAEEPKKEETEKEEPVKTEEPVEAEEPEDKTISETNEKPSKKDDKIDFKTDDGQLAYKKHKVVKDYEGNPAIVIYFDYTNLSDKASSAMLTFSVKPFQNGVECGTAIITEDIKEKSNCMKQVKKDTTLAVAFAYSLEDTKSDVELEVSKLISLSDEMATQILKLK